MRHFSRKDYRRALEFWPYLFIIVSVSGLGYIAVMASR
jgi:hypothetical protein